MKILTIKAFSIGGDKPFANRMTVVNNPDDITLREFIDKKIGAEADVHNITQVTITNDQTDIVDLLDVPIAWLLEQLDSMNRPEIAVTVDMTASDSDNINSEARGGNDSIKVGEGKDESLQHQPPISAEAIQMGSTAKPICSKSTSGSYLISPETTAPNEGSSSNDDLSEAKEETILENTKDDDDDDDSRDALAQIVAQALIVQQGINPQEAVRGNFDPASKSPLLPVWLSPANMMDTISVMTPNSVSICEPVLPVQEYKNYQESSVPDIVILRELINDFIVANNDGGAIVEVTDALILDNGLSQSSDMPLFCLTTLWVLARKSDKNRHKIIFDGVTFEAITEAMFIHRKNVEIQTRACGLLWSLSMDPKDRFRVAQQSGGCDSILDAMAEHMEDSGLQEMAMGALKVLSSSLESKKVVHTTRAIAMIANVMEKHAYSPPIQTDGCVTLANLVVNDADQSACPVSEKEIGVVLNGILSNPDSLDVHEAACFALMCLASSQSNVGLIRKSSICQTALEIAFGQNPGKVGNNILILLRRLGFDP